jgi:hypothetical protein
MRNEIHYNLQSPKHKPNIHYSLSSYSLQLHKYRTFAVVVEIMQQVQLCLYYQMNMSHTCRTLSRECKDKLHYHYGKNIKENILNR